MLRINGVGRRYASGLEALRDVDLTVGVGEVIALLGPSGCGKSTLLRVIAGLDQPQSGRLIWDSGRPPAPGRIGMVFQDPVLLPWADAAGNAALPLRLRGADRGAAEAEASAILAELGLAGFAAAKPRALSGGMRMRVALARALSTKPDLLLLDEPFAALDEPTRHKLQEELRRLHRTRAVTIVLVTHSIYEAAFCATRVAVMSARPGRITEVIPVAEHADRLSPAYAETVATISRAMPA